jgi:hypothetical protein
MATISQKVRVGQFGLDFAQLTHDSISPQFYSTFVLPFGKSIGSARRGGISSLN